MATQIRRTEHAASMRHMTKLEREGQRHGNMSAQQVIAEAVRVTPTLQTAAEQLGISRSTLYRYMKRYDMEVISS